MDATLNTYWYTLKQIHFLSVHDYYESLKELLLSLDHATREFIYQALIQERQSSSTVIEKNSSNHHHSTSENYQLREYGISCLFLYDDNNHSYRELIQNSLSQIVNHYEMRRSNNLLEQARKLLALCHHNIGKLYVEQKEWRSAIQEFEFAIKYDSKFVSAYNNMGLSYRQLYEITNALETYQQGIKLCPNYVSLHYNSGNAYMQLHRYNQAIECYTRAIKVDPTFTSSYENRGLAYYHKQMFVLSLRDLHPIHSREETRRYLLESIHESNADVLFTQL
jgi:tetratricopeptide (TPR) repeat protein